MIAEERPVTSEVYETAVMLTRLGVSVIPIQPGTKEPPLGFRWGEYTTRIADASEVYEWFEVKRWHLAVVCGAVSGHLVVIDFDRTSHKDGGYQDWAAEHPAIHALPRSMTGKGRIHVFCRSTEPTDKYVVGEPGDQVEVRSGNHYVVVPPSIHPETGQPYRWSERQPITDGIPRIDLRTIGFEPKLRSDTEREPGSEGQPLSDDEIARLVEFVSPFWKEGQRHNLALALSGWMAGYSVPEIDAHEVIGSLARHEPASDRRDVLTTVETTYARWREGIAVAGWSMLTDATAPLISRATAGQLEWLLKQRQGSITFRKAVVNDEGPPQPRALRYPLTDSGNAERLVELHGDDLRFCNIWNKWLVWDGMRWHTDDTAEVDRRALRTTRAIAADAVAEESLGRDEFHELMKWSKASESHAKQVAMVKLAGRESRVVVTPDQLDRDGWKFGVQNGVVDTRDGTNGEQDRGALMTRVSGTDYRSDAQCPSFMAFLNQITHNPETNQARPELVSYLQRAIGYSLTGDTSERVMFILHGSGKNGKSTFIDVMREVMGDYAMRVPTDTLMARRNESIPNDIARLKGARFVFASETDDGKRLSESLIKDLTGGDTISARFMRGEWFDFKPEFKLWLATNHRPTIRGTDPAIWDRIHLIPFDVRISDEQQDRNLPKRLRKELPGILNWAIAGCLEWQRDGLKPPACVLAATSEYRANMDRLSPFLDECCVVRQNARATSKDLYAAYKHWCEENGERYLRQQDFGTKLSEKGFQATKGSKGVRLWIGLQLANSPQQVALGGVGGATVGITTKSHSTYRDKPENHATYATHATEQDGDDDEPDF